MIIDGLDPERYNWNDVTTWLQDTLTLLGPNGEYWTKGSYHDRATGCRCLVGALTRCDGSPTTYPQGVDDRRVSYSYPAEALVQIAVMTDFPYRDMGESVIGFNDHHLTTWPEIKTVLTEAIRLSKEREAAYGEAREDG